MSETPTTKFRDAATIAREKREARGAAPASSWTAPAIALLAVGLLLVLMAGLFLFTTGNVFVGILGGVLMTSGMAWLAGFLVTRVHP